MSEQKSKKPFYKKWWFYLIVGFIVIGAIGGGNSTTKDSGTVGTEQDVSKSEKPEENVPAEYNSALKKAKTYSDIMSMSKVGIYDQLKSEYGEKFTAEAAQYAVDNVKADWKENALKKAKTYQETMSMSPSAIYDQLISEHGEKFTAEEAQYAIDNL